jgi:hypothetical protein
MVMRSAEEASYRANKDRQKSWSLPFEINPTGADDYFAYIKNTGSKPLVIERISGETDVAGTIEVHSVTGTQSGGSDVSPVSKSVGGGPDPIADFKTAVDITGLTKVGNLGLLGLGVASVQRTEKFPEGIRILSGKAVALLWDTSTGTLSGIAHVYEEADSD